MSDEEVSRELKIVQLQREKIQLEKELAQKQRVEKVSAALESSGNFSLNLLKFFRRNLFKILLFPTIIFVGITAFNAIEDSRAAAYYKDKNTYALQTCGEAKRLSSCNMDSECMDREMERSLCYIGAEAKFQRDNAPTLFFRKIYFRYLC